MTLNVCKVGGRSEHVSSFVNSVPLMDSHKNVIYFKVFGFETISGMLIPVNVEIKEYTLQGKGSLR